MSAAAAAPPVEPAPIPFGRLVRAEWRKATDTRAARWLILLSVLATIGFELAPLLAANSIEQDDKTYLQFTTFGLSSLLPVVSILTLTTEWTQRTVLTTFTAEPRRHRVIEAKVLVSLLMAIAAVILGALVALVAIVIANGTGRDVEADLSAAGVVGYVLFIVVNIGVGVAFGALLHNTAAAIVLFFVLPIAFTLLGSAVSGVNDWLNTNRTFSWLLGGEFAGHVPNILVSVGVWLVLPLLLGVLRTARREIT